MRDGRQACCVAGRRVAPGVSLCNLRPPRCATRRQAEREGTLAILLDAGAQLLPNACNACAGYGPSWASRPTAAPLPPPRAILPAAMGDSGSAVWLASPLTVAASAVTGSITDPRALLP
ncbi:aconitase family protein [Cupriavidus basilensis]